MQETGAVANHILKRFGYACKRGWNPADYYLTLIDVVRTSAGTGENDAAASEAVPWHNHHNAAAAVTGPRMRSCQCPRRK